jgi:prophage regulatory protein
MSSVPVDNGRSSTDFQTNGRRHSSPCALTKKMPQPDLPDNSQKSGTVGSMDEVILMRLPEARAITGLSKTTIYESIRERSFPPPVRLGSRVVAWVKSGVRQWAVERVRASRLVA